MSRESERQRVKRLLGLAVPGVIDGADGAVLESAMLTAMDITHECGHQETTDEAYLETFRDAIRRAARDMK